MTDKQALLNALTELADAVEKEASTLGTQRANLVRLVNDPNRHPEIDQSLRMVEDVIENLVLTAASAKSIVENMDESTPAPTLDVTATVTQDVAGAGSPAEQPLPPDATPPSVVGSMVATVLPDGTVTSVEPANVNDTPPALADPSALAPAPEAVATGRVIDAAAGDAVTPATT